MTKDPCLQLNEDWDTVRKELNDGFRVFPRAINKVSDGMNQLTEDAYKSFNGVVSAINYATVEPLRPINELTDSVKEFINTITNMPSVLGVVQILLMPFFIQIKNVLDTIFFFLPNIPLNIIALVVLLIAAFLVLGHLLGSIFSVVFVAFKMVDLISNVIAEPLLWLILGDGFPQLFIDILGWSVLALIAFVLFRLFFRIPVPCKCGDPPDSSYLICQKGSERGSEECKRIQSENEKMEAAIARIRERGGRIIGKAQALIPELPMTELPDLKLPAKIGKVPEVDLFPALGLPACGARIQSELRKAESALESAAKDIGNFFSGLF